jgi:hypothetical protein
MAQRVQLWSVARCAALLTGCLLVTQFPSARAQDKIKAPEWKHGMNLKVRKPGVAIFDANTQRYGVEVFLDPNTGKIAYISDTGSLAALSGTTAGGNSKEPDLRHGLELRVRKAGEPDFTDKTKKVGVEVFFDSSAGNLVYVSDTGSIAVVPGGAEPTKEVKKPVWRHGLEMPVRKAGEDLFTDKTQRYGMEVFVDDNNGNVIYITETGAIAVVPGAGLPPRPEKVESPKWKHAMELRVRDAGKVDFNDMTPKIGLEVYHDPNANKLVVVSQTGNIAVLNGTTTDAKSKDPVWKHGIELAARKAGQMEFDKAPRYGVEVYTDEITNAMIYIAQTGSVAAIPMK